MLGLIGKKIGMTSTFDENGKNIPCTVIEAGPCVVTQVKVQEKEGYNAVQLGFKEKKSKNVTSALKGHFKKAGVSPQTVLMEFRDVEEIKNGDTVDLSKFQVGESVNVVGTSKGKGFQGVVKRHGFSGASESTHGQNGQLRASGAVGACSTPSRVFKGMKMAGQMGNEKVMMGNLKIVKLFHDKNLILLKGAVPGSKGSYLKIEKWN